MLPWSNCQWQEGHFGNGAVVPSFQEKAFHGSAEGGIESLPLSMSLDGRSAHSNTLTVYRANHGPTIPDVFAPSHCPSDFSQRGRPFLLCVCDLPGPSHNPPTLSRAVTDQSRNRGCSLGGCPFARQRCQLDTHCTGVPGHSPKGDKKKERLTPEKEEG